MKLPDSLRAFRHPDYRMFFAGQLVSQIGTWMQSVGQSWLIVTLTSSALKLGLISTLQFLPTLLFALFGGALADRLPKRKTLIGTQSILMILAFVLSALVLTHHVQYWHVAVLAALLGLTNTLDMPVRQAYTVEMVGGREDLGNAIALNSALFNGARLVGPAVAGLLIAKYGVGLAFFLNGVSFLAVIVALFFMKAQGLPRPRANRSILKDVGEGLRYSYATPVVFLLLSLLFFIGLFVINFQVLIPVLAKQVLGGDARTYGYLMSSLGAGALLGAMGLAHFSAKGKSNLNLLVTMGLLLCTVTASVFFIHSFWLACVGLFMMGVTQITYTASTNTTLQVTAPDEMRGRVMSLYQLAFAGTTPFGSLFTGAVIERWNGSAGFLVDGGIGLILALGLLLWWQWRRGRSGLRGSGGLAAGM
ncbi:MAG: MFS transporter [Mycobacterium leprae]